MSAYLVDDATLDVIVRAAIRFRLVAPASATLVGQALRWENIASVSFRYPNDALRQETMPGPTAVPPLLGGDPTAAIAPTAWLNPSTYTYTKRTPGEPRLDLRAVMGCVRCYEYQSCEHTNWQHSASFALLTKLRAALGAAGVPTGESDQAGTWGVSSIAEAHERVAV